MNLKRSFLTVMLALGLLLPSVVGVTGSIQNSTDEKGIIHIRTVGPAEKGNPDGKDSNLKAPAEPGVPGQVNSGEQEPLGLVTPQSRRSRAGRAAEARQKALEKARPNLIPPSKETEANLTPAPPGAKAAAEPAPEAPAAQLEHPPAPDSP